MSLMYNTGRDETHKKYFFNIENGVCVRARAKKVRSGCPRKRGVLFSLKPMRIEINSKAASWASVKRLLETDVGVASVTSVESAWCCCLWLRR